MIGLKSSMVAAAMLPLAACATLPEATKPATVCIYETLKSTPGIVAVEVYVSRNGPSIAYAYRKPDGERDVDELEIAVRPDAPRRYSYSGDITNPLNPVSRLGDALSGKCRADGYYEDQVIVMRDPPPPAPHVRVTMPD